MYLNISTDTTSIFIHQIESVPASPLGLVPVGDTGKFFLKFRLFQVGPWPICPPAYAIECGLTDIHNGW